MLDSYTDFSKISTEKLQLHHVPPKIHETRLKHHKFREKRLAFPSGNHRVFLQEKKFRRRESEGKGGRINGETARTISPEWSLAFRTGDDGDAGGRGGGGEWALGRGEVVL